MALGTRPLRIVLLGPPASGKGTQGRRLASSLGLDYLSTGALLREQVQNATELGKKAEAILTRGEYLPDDLMCPLLADWLEKGNGDQKGWVLDGFPRSLPQAIFLDQWLAEKDSQLDAVISLEVSFEELVTRIQNRVECPGCRWTGQRNQLVGTDQCPVCESKAQTRSDDNEENFRKRYAEFLRLTGPVIEHYKKLGLLSACDSTASQDEVAAQLLATFAVPV